MKKIIKDLIPYVVIVIVVVLVRAFLITPVIVSGDSMEPTLKDKQLLLLNKLDYKINEIERFDIVVIRIESYDAWNIPKEKEIIKRVIGLPGEEVLYRNNSLYIDGHEVENEYNFDTEDFSLKTICNCTRIPEDKYLVLGDNRSISADSRIMGLIDKKYIEGTVDVSLWPIKKVK